MPTQTTPWARPPSEEGDLMLRCTRARACGAEVVAMWVLQLCGHEHPLSCSCVATSTLLPAAVWL